MEIESVRPNRIALETKFKLKYSVCFLYSNMSSDTGRPLWIAIIKTDKIINGVYIDRYCYKLLYPNFQIYRLR